MGGHSRPVAGAEWSLGIGGMSCAACVGRVEKALAQVPGVSGVQVNLATETAQLKTAPNLSPQALAEVQLLAQRRLREAGYEPRLPTQANHLAPELPLWQRETTHLALGLLLCLPLVAPMFWMGLGPSHAESHTHYPAWLGWVMQAWVQALLSTLVLALLGARLWRGAWHGLKVGVGNMEQLVVLGTTAAWGLSTWMAWNLGWVLPEHAAPVHLYYESAAVVVALVRLGKWLEGRAKREASAALRALHSLRPEMAHLLADPQAKTAARKKDQDWPTAELLPGDRVRVLAGERFPADGVVESGETEADESLMTGESRPQPKAPGQTVLGGSLNGEGVVVVQLTHSGTQGWLATMTAMVEAAQMKKPRIQQRVDQVAAVFVPVVLGLATLTALGWWLSGAGWEAALVHATSVLVVACPCALGLATPTAILVGTTVAARHGILIQDPTALDQAPHIGTVLLDKTGTLTQGRPSVAACEPVAGVEAGTVLAWAAALSTHSTHPLAHAVMAAVAHTHHDLPPVTAVRNVPGCGTEAMAHTPEGLETPVRLGQVQWLVQCKAVTPEQLSQAYALAAKGWTVSGVAVGERLLGWLAFVDAPKPDAAASVAQLKRLGLRVLMVSGDNTAAARHVAQQVGLDASEVHAEVKPEDKVRWVEHHQNQNGMHKVLMVGDGINDAPALALADLSMAMNNPAPTGQQGVQGSSQGTDVALQAAHMSLMRGRMSDVVHGLDIARATVRNIHQNLFWAFAYNAACLPLAALGVFSPMWAGAAMAFSSVSVVLNALRLSRWKPPVWGQQAVDNE